MRRAEILFLIFVSAYALSPEASQANSARSTFGFRSAVVVNDEPSFGFSVVQPFYLYRSASDVGRPGPSETNRGTTFSLLTAILFNRATVEVPVNEKAVWTTEALLSFMIAGDSPRIDGVDLKDFEFDAHSSSVKTGVRYQLLEKLSTQATVKASGLWIYNEAVKTRLPGSFYHIGIENKATLGSSESWTWLLDQSDRLSLYTGFVRRLNPARWGDVGFSKRMSQSFDVSLASSSVFRVNRDLLITMKAQGMMQSNADRIHATRGVHLEHEQYAIPLTDTVSDRAIASEIGLRKNLLPFPQLVLRPFAHFTAFREVTPTKYKTREGYGGGLQLAGLFDEKYFWELGYSNVFGTRSDLHGLHQVEARFSASF